MARNLKAFKQRQHERISTQLTGTERETEGRLGL